MICVKNAGKPQGGSRIIPCTFRANANFAANLMSVPASNVHEGLRSSVAPKRNLDKTTLENRRVACQLGQTNQGGLQRDE
ncbi:hypothetical protein I6F19_05510 [Ensifer sp. BRP08]|nr:hypothetical protein [Ensifer sp. BRP08]